MTPEERQLLVSMLDRVRSTPVPEKDPEADHLIAQLVQTKPDTPYLLTQAVIIQDFAMRHAQEQLQAAQAQIADLQRQVAEARNGGDQPVKSGGFLSSLFGTGSSVQSSGNPSGPSGSVPQASGGPWGRPLNPNGGQGTYAGQPQPNYAPPPNYQQAGYAQPGGYAAQTQAPVFQPSQSSGFLRNAAQTALGVAGGALLFQGVESMFSGGHGGGFGGFGGGGFGGGMGPTENVTETVNNYYDTPGPSGTDYAGPTNDPGYSDASFDPGNDLSSSDNFDTGGSDFGGGGNDDWV